jgi:hypothetical protein
MKTAYGIQNVIAPAERATAGPMVNCFLRPSQPPTMVCSLTHSFPSHLWCFDHSFVTVLLCAYLPYDPLLPELALLIGDHDSVVSKSVHAIAIAVAP